MVALCYKRMLVISRIAGVGGLCVAIFVVFAISSQNKTHNPSLITAVYQASAGRKIQQYEINTGQFASNVNTEYKSVFDTHSKLYPYTADVNKTGHKSNEQIHSTNHDWSASVGLSELGAASQTRNTDTPPAPQHCLIQRFHEQFRTSTDLSLVQDCTRFVYNRVPKCGSRTVVSTFKLLAKRNGFQLIGRNKPSESLNFFTNSSQKRSLVRELHSWTPPYVYTQHLHFLQPASTAEEPLAFINVIRDPTERLISHYYYQLYGSPNDNRNLSKAVMSLDECMLSEQGSCKTIHQVLPFFCGQTLRCRRDEEYALNVARRTLEQQALVVGFTEDLANFMLVLEYIAPHVFKGAPEVYNAVYLQSKQRTQTVLKPEVREETRRAIKDMLRYEYEFYLAARQQFYSMLQTVLSVKRQEIQSEQLIALDPESTE